MEENKLKRLTPRKLGTNPRSLGTNPKALGINPKNLGINPTALGTNPRSLGLNPKNLGITIRQLLAEINRAIKMDSSSPLLDSLFTMKLTLAGKVRLLAFSKEAIQYADRQHPTTFKEFIRYCREYSNEQGEYLDYEPLINIAHQEGVQPLDPCIDHWTLSGDMLGKNAQRKAQARGIMIKTSKKSEDRQTEFSHDLVEFLKGKGKIK